MCRSKNTYYPGKECPHMTYPKTYEAQFGLLVVQGLISFHVTDLLGIQVSVTSQSAKILVLVSSCGILRGRILR